MSFCDFQPFLPSWPTWHFQSWKMCLRNILFNYKYSDLICWYLKSRCSYIEKLGFKKTTDQNKLSIQCFSYCLQTRKESKYSFILPVLYTRGPQKWAVAATSPAKHWDPAAGSVQGGAAEQLQAPGWEEMSNSLQQTYSTALWPSALEHPPTPTAPC